MTKPTIKIFISSPGDVLYERQIAKRIIAKLGKEFAASVHLEALMWEDMPLLATASFQEGIDRVANAEMVDIALFILWSRLGTPLNDKFVKADGSRYQSGTEYEFEVMYAANRKSGTPSILAYIKNAPIADAIFQSSAGADFDIEEIGRQHKEAQRFIREKFYDPVTKTVYGAYHLFEAPTTFEQKVTEHLRKLIVTKIGHEVVPIEWEGNPYVGLRSFRYDENAIFYGRRQTINLIEEKINRLLPNKAPCLFVLGESGSGKSSLVRAGLLPDIIEFGWVEQTKWRWFDIMPNQFRGNVYNGITAKLAEAFPILNDKVIGKDLINGKEVNFVHLADILPDTKQEAVLFFIDQFEEIFTDPLITEEERIRTFTLLHGMALTRKIWMFFSMRSDFYHRFTAYPLLWELKNEAIVYDLPKILYSELQEIVEEPAKKAGLKWETNAQGVMLNKTILHDINKGVDDLPLIEFALSELYNLRNENSVLTYQAYEEIGKIDGAVIKYVDNFHNTLSEKEKELFYQLLSALIAPSVENKNVYVRKTALLKDVQKTELHKQVIGKLINSHILISGKDEKENPTVSMVHEILISSWRTIQEWITRERYFIDLNNHYENLSKYWIERNQSKNDLLQGVEVVKEAEYFLFSWENNCAANVRDFLFTSVKRKKRTLLPWVLLFLSGVGVLGIVSLFEYISKGVFPPINDIIPFCMAFGLLIYAAWKRLKTNPVYKTIDISLMVWTGTFICSLILPFISKGSNVWIISLLVFLKLAYTIYQKREVELWKKRIFNRGINYVSLLLDNSSKSLQKALRTLIWGVSILLIIAICVGGPFIFYLIDENEKLDKTYETVDKLFERLNNHPALSEEERLFIHQHQATYLKDNFFVEKPNMFTGKLVFGGWKSEEYYYDYVLCRYHLGHPEDFMEGIKTAFESGKFDECRKLIDLYPNKENDAEILMIEKELQK